MIGLQMVFLSELADEEQEFKKSARSSAVKNIDPDFDPYEELSGSPFSNSSDSKVKKCSSPSKKKSSKNPAKMKFEGKPVGFGCSSVMSPNAHPINRNALLARNIEILKKHLVAPARFNPYGIKHPNDSVKPVVLQQPNLLKALDTMKFPQGRSNISTGGTTATTSNSQVQSSYSSTCLVVPKVENAEAPRNHKSNGIKASSVINKSGQSISAQNVGSLSTSQDEMLLHLDETIDSVIADCSRSVPMNQSVGKLAVSKVSHRPTNSNDKNISNERDKVSLVASNMMMAATDALNMTKCMESHAISSKNSPMKGQYSKSPAKGSNEDRKQVKSTGAGPISSLKSVLKRSPPKDFKEGVLASKSPKKSVDLLTSDRQISGTTDGKTNKPKPHGGSRKQQLKPTVLPESFTSNDSCLVSDLNPDFTKITSSPTKTPKRGEPNAGPVFNDLRPESTSLGALKNFMPTQRYLPPKPILNPPVISTSVSTPVPSESSVIMQGNQSSSSVTRTTSQVEQASMLMALSQPRGQNGNQMAVTTSSYQMPPSACSTPYAPTIITTGEQQAPLQTTQLVYQQQQTFISSQSQFSLQPQVQIGQVTGSPYGNNNSIGMNTFGPSNTTTAMPMSYASGPIYQQQQVTQMPQQATQSPMFIIPFQTAPSAVICSAPVVPTQSGNNTLTLHYADSGELGSGGPLVLNNNNNGKGMNNGSSSSGCDGFVPSDSAGQYLASGGMMNNESSKILFSGNSGIQQGVQMNPIVQGNAPLTMIPTSFYGVQFQQNLPSQGYPTPRHK